MMIVHVRAVPSFDQRRRALPGSGLPQPGRKAARRARARDGVQLVVTVGRLVRRRRPRSTSCRPSEVRGSSARHRSEIPRRSNSSPTGTTPTTTLRRDFRAAARHDRPRRAVPVLDQDAGEVPASALTADREARRRARTRHARKFAVDRRRTVRARGDDPSGPALSFDQGRRQLFAASGAPPRSRVVEPAQVTALSNPVGEAGVRMRHDRPGGRVPTLDQAQAVRITDCEATARRPHTTRAGTPTPGTVALAHAVPFHRSINGAPAAKPTAKQFDAGWHVTASNWALAGLGAGRPPTRSTPTTGRRRSAASYSIGRRRPRSRT